MPKMNIDEQKSLFESIEITLEGKNYVVDKISEDIVGAVEQAGRDSKDKEGKVKDVGVLSKQLSILTGKPVEEFRGVDIRKLGAAVRFIVDTFQEQVKGDSKNGQSAEVKE